MYKVNVLEAKTNFSRLLALLENHQEEEIIVCKSGKPVAKMVLMEPDVSKRIGLFKGQFKAPSVEEFDEMNDEIAKLFGVE